jgi:hypothetical protein
MHTERVDTPITNHDNGVPDESPRQHSALTASTPKEYEVRAVSRSDIKDFMEKWHYSHNINGLSCRYCFGLYWHDTLIGAMIYGKMAMHNQWRKYADDDILQAFDAGDMPASQAESTVIELRRLACIDDTVRNTESYFIGKTLRWLKNNAHEVRTIVSYADTAYGHRGIIYQASNFRNEGKTSAGRVIVWHHDGVDHRYHDHAIRTKYHGHLKPFAARLKQALDDGEARYESTPGKNIYVYRMVS